MISANFVCPDQLAVENLEAIASTPGLNALMLGPSDLRVSLGLPLQRGESHDDQQFLSSVEKVIRASKKYQIPLLTTCFKAGASDAWIREFTMLLVTSDALGIINSARSQLQNWQNIMVQPAKNMSSVWHDPA